MAAFVPRALAKRQKVSLPGRRGSTLPDAGEDAKASTRSKGNGLNVLAPGNHVGTIAAERNPSSKKVDAAVALGTALSLEGVTRTSAGLQSWKKKQIAEYDVTFIAPLDEGPDALPISKQQDGGRKRRLRTLSGEDMPLKGSVSQASTLSGKERQLVQSAGRLGSPVLLTRSPGQCPPVETPLRDTAAGASLQNRTSVAESAALDLTRNAESTALDCIRNAESAVSPSGEKGGAAQETPFDGKLEGVLSDGRGGRTIGGPKKQAGKQIKKVFPYGNYDRYYGYRFGKTLSEDPRLSVFQKEWFEGKACLDVGCNEGYVTIAVAQLFQCASMVGVDIDGSLVAKARSHLSREAAPNHQAKKPRLDLTGQANQTQVKQTPLGGTHTKFIGHADQSGVKQTLLGGGRNNVTGQADQSGVKPTLSGKAPSGDEGTVSKVRKRKWVSLTERTGSDDKAGLEREGVSAQHDNGQEARESESVDADVSERGAEETADVIDVGASSVRSRRGDADGPTDVSVETAAVIDSERQGAFSDGGIGVAQETADVRAKASDADVRVGDSGADVSNGGVERSDDVSNGGVERSADVSGGGVKRSADGSSGNVERSADVCNGGVGNDAHVSNGGFEKGADVRNGAVERGTDLSAVESAPEAVGNPLDRELRNENRSGSTGIGEAAGLETVSLTGDEPCHVAEDDTCPEAVGPSAVGTSREGRSFPHNVRFRKENFVESPLEEEAYDVVMSLSVVKWIHLNWGDAGLLRFFAKVYKTLKPGGLFILEPQPWKSYRNNRGVSKATQRHFKEIKITPDQFPDVLKSQIGFRSADIVTPAVPGSLGGFGRAIHLYRK